jgi:hypothetical protein
VPGFLDPPLADVGPPPPPLTDARYNLWSVELDDVVAEHVREIWVDTLRYSGDLEVRGWWVFRPMRVLEVGDATVDVRDLDVGYGMVEPWATSVVGRLAVRVHRVDLQTVKGLQLINSVSLRGHLEGTAQVATAVNRATGGSWLKLAPSSAPFTLMANIEHGVLGPGTALRLATFDAGAVAVGLDFEGKLEGDLQVDERNLGHADLRAAGVRVLEGPRRRARAASIVTSLSSRELDLTHPFSDTTFAVEVDEAETDSLAYWRSRIAPASDVQIASGSLTAGGRLAGALSGKTLSGHVAFAARALSLAHGDVAGEGNVDGRVDLDRMDLDKHTLAGAIDLTAERAIVHFGAATLQSDARVHVRIPEGRWRALRLDLSGSKVSLVDARATVKGVRFDIPVFEAATQNLVLGPAGPVGTLSVLAPRVELRSLATLAALVPLPDDVSVDGGAGTASLRGVVDVARLTFSGDARIVARGLRVRMGAQTMPGELTVQLLATGRGDLTDLSGSSVTFRGAGVPETLDWWARVHLRDTTLSIRPRVRFRSLITAEAKDASPWTALVASSTPIPQWLMNVVSTEQFEVTGELLVTPSVLAARSVQADSRGADVRFELSKIQTVVSWAMLLDLGVVVMGVDVVHGKTDVLLFGARPWFDRRALSLGAAERQHE